MEPTSAINHPIRLKPGQDLLSSIAAYVKDHDIRAGWIATCAGSLTQVNLRYANQPGGTVLTGHFEIVSLTGTVSSNGCHLHMSVADSTGYTRGGHLMEGNIIYTTAELVIVQSPAHVFTREEDGSTPWKELQIRER